MLVNRKKVPIETKILFLALYYLFVLLRNYKYAHETMPDVNCQISAAEYAFIQLAVKRLCINNL